MTSTTKTGSPPYPHIWLAASALSLVVLAINVYILWISPERGLHVLWSLIIPLAPLIFLVTPNAWVSACPLAILQSLPGRFGLSLKKRLQPQTIRNLQHLSWAVLFLLVPARIFLFNLNAPVVLITIGLLAITALAFGVTFEGFGGWCSGLCPIRPVEMLYGQFSKESHRPESCTRCSTCQIECSRLHSNDRETKVANMTPFQHQIFSFPGFILGSFLSSSSDPIALVYLKCLGIALISWALFNFLIRGPKAIIFSGIAAFTLYYGFTVPQVVEVWNLPPSLVPVFYVTIFGVLMISIRHLVVSRKAV